MPSRLFLGSNYLVRFLGPLCRGSSINVAVLAIDRGLYPGLLHFLSIFPYLRPKGLPFRLLDAFQWGAIHFLPSFGVGSLFFLVGVRLRRFSNLLVDLTSPVLSRTSATSASAGVAGVLLAIPMTSHYYLDRSLLRDQYPTISKGVGGATGGPYTGVSRFHGFAFYPGGLLHAFRRSIARVVKVLFRFRQHPLSFPLYPILRGRASRDAIGVFPNSSNFRALFLAYLVFRRPQSRSIGGVVLRDIASRVSRLSHPYLFLAFFSTLLSRPN